MSAETSTDNISDCLSQLRCPIKIGDLAADRLRNALAAKPPKSDQVSRKLAIAKRELTTAIVVRDSLLAEVARVNRISALPLESGAAVVGNVDATLANDEAAAAVAAAVELALAVTAWGPTEKLLAVRAELVAAVEALEAVDAALLAEDPAADPAEDPAETRFRTRPTPPTSSRSSGPRERCLA